MTDPIARDDDRDDPKPGASPARIDWSACLRCGQPIESLGVAELRTGGMTGAAHLLLGQWAELGEGKLTVALFACSSCGHIELRQPG
jgi:hypothetical protein